MIVGGFAISPIVGRLPASAYRRLGEFLGAFRTHRMSSLLGGERLNLEPKVKLDQPAIGTVSRKRALTSVRPPRIAAVLRLGPQ